jgi:hypothetical protein
MTYRRNTHKKRHNKKRHSRKLRQRGGRMTTTVDTNPISYRDEEYKEMNELAFKGGLNTNTPESQGPMTLDELNISSISSNTNTNTNDNMLTEYQQNNISGFAQDQDEGWQDQLNEIMQQINEQNPNQNNNAQFWNDTLASDEEAYTEMESYPSFGSQNGLSSSFPTTSSIASTITDDTMGSDMSMGGRKRKTNKKRRNNKKRRTHRKINKRR